MLAPVIFKANDIRGVVAAEWDATGAAALGQAYARLMKYPKIVVGRDMRLSGPEIHQSFVGALAAAGVSVVDAGLTSTDELWFASGVLGLPGVQITSSHNPSQYNGMKFCLPGARPVTSNFLTALALLAREVDAGGQWVRAESVGMVEPVDILPDYVAYLLSRVDMSEMRHLTIVVDAGNGMGGHTAPAVLSQLDVEMIGLYLDLDGAFPHHQPNPLEPQNLVDAQAAVRAHGADLAIVFDGDADRVFLIDERGEVVPPSAITALIASHHLAHEPGATIVVNHVTSAAVSEIVQELGGQVVRSRVGHTYMKALMAEHDAVFGGEHSAHYYFRDFFGADTGMLAALHVISALGGTEQPLSALVSEYTRYAASGEINSVVRDQQVAMERVAQALGEEMEATWDDGVMLTARGSWVSLRPSNTEPLLRLNVEARSPQHMCTLRDKVLALIKED